MSLLQFERVITGPTPSRQSPAQVNARALVDTLFDASLRSEEGHQLKCLVTCLSQKGARPSNFIAWTWRPLSAREIAKAAMATDPRSSSLAVVWTQAAHWSLVGMIARLPTTPVGVFQIGIEGVAHLSYRHAGSTVAEYVRDEVLTTAPDVLRSGPVAAKLRWSQLQIDVIAEVLQRIDTQGHGGAILVHDKSAASTTNLAITYATSRKPYVGLQAAASPKSSGRSRELAMWVTSSMTRVDGAVVMNSALQILGNGARLGAPPTNAVRVATRTDGRYARLAKLGGWGTRHGSMIAYCKTYSDAVGFVISEDGGVRAVTRVGGAVEATMWERIRLGGTDLPPTIP